MVGSGSQVQVECVTLLPGDKAQLFQLRMCCSRQEVGGAGFLLRIASIQRLVT